MTTLPRTNKAAKKRPRSAFGDEIATVLNPTSDVETVLGSVIGTDRARKAVDCIRRVKLRELTQGVKWEAEPVHEANTPQERRACALLLMVLSWVTPTGRAWTSKLFRGHNKRLTDDGALEHMPAKSAGGLAARLGISPREIDRYLQVWKAAGILQVWQGPNDAPKRFRGAEYAYAVFQWVGEVPRAVSERLANWWRRAPRAGDAPKATTQAAAAMAAARPSERGTTETASKLAADLFARFAPPS